MKWIWTPTSKIVKTSAETKGSLVKNLGSELGNWKKKMIPLMCFWKILRIKKKKII